MMENEVKGYNNFTEQLGREIDSGYHSSYKRTEVRRMDVTEFLGDNITLDVVKSSPSKKIVILSGGVLKEFDGKKKLVILVEMDGRQLNYIPNKTSMKNIAEICGKESTAWIGKQVQLEIGSVNGKEAVLGKILIPTELQQPTAPIPTAEAIAPQPQ
ncbi:hypothetical protein LCGC14_1219990 [marine sediment metagenome]|uniref:Uncharacterized protein n=1 Tax=marine sediment metagenome TaxID=412755 RepID=A0A0F9LYZ9_9ZZZZ